MDVRVGPQRRLITVDTFKLQCWRRLLRVPWTATRSNQSILKELNPEYSLKGLMLQLKLQNFSHLMQSANSPEKTLMLGKIEDRRRRGWQRIRWLDGITDSMDMGLSKLWEIVKVREAWPAVVHGATKSWTWLSNSITAKENGLVRGESVHLRTKNFKWILNPSCWPQDQCSYLTCSTASWGPSARIQLPSILFLMMPLWDLGLNYTTEYHLQLWPV